MRDAGEFMGATVRELAQARPDLCDKSGRGFWAANVNFPYLLSHTLNRVQAATTRAYRDGSLEDAKMLAQTRIDFLKVTYEGDLGEDHIEYFLQDHPGIAELPRETWRALPYAGFCGSVLKIRDPIALLGALTRNEEGSLDEIATLVETGLIAEGVFSKTHMVEEEEHARISAGIRERLMGSRYRQAFERGMDLHDRLYGKVPSEAEH